MDDSLTNIGTVIQVEGDNAVVKLAPQEECKKCGAAILCKPNASADRTMKVKSKLATRIGNEVVISEPDNLLLKIYSMQYGVPFLGFVLGIFALYFLGLSTAPIPDEILMFCGGLLGLVSGGFISWIWAKRTAKNQSIYFEITKIIS